METPASAGTVAGAKKATQIGQGGFYQTTAVASNKISPRERLKARVTIGKDGCWLWQGPVDRDGYGKASLAGKSWQAHRLAYTLAIGPIPAGMILHHHCRNPQCCNPLHLDPCTPLENTMRGVSPPACNSRKVACDHGHAFDAGNTYRWRHRRNCRACNREAARRYKVRKGGAA